MKIQWTKQISYSYLNQVFKFDYLFVASGYESRACFFAQYHKLDIKHKIVFAFQECQDDTTRLRNDSIFESLGFKFIEEGSSSSAAIAKCLEEILVADKKRKVLRIIVDYSCMSRNWYSTMLYLIKNQKGFDGKIEVYFTYSPALYVDPPLVSMRNTIVEPIEGFSNLYIPMKPVALVVGLGFETVRAYGLSEYFNSISYYFYGDMSYNPEYSEQVKSRNEELLDSVDQSKKFPFPLNDLEYTESMLMVLCTELSKKHKVILAPCGPKIFTLLCLILSLKLDTVDVWRISPGKFGPKIDKKANNDLLIYNVNFI